MDEEEEVEPTGDGRRPSRRPRFSVSGEEAERCGAVRNDAMVRDFTENFLRVDGVFLLRLIAHNTSGITTTEITKEIWDQWYEKRHGLTGADHIDDSTEIKRPFE